MSSKNFLIISNIFEKFERKPIEFWKKDNNELEHYINIPELSINRKSTAFYISRENKNLNLKNIWKSITNTKSTNLFFKHLSNNKENYITNKNEILRNISFLNLREEKYDIDEKLPFNEIWEACLNDVIKSKKEDDLIIFQKDFELIMKNSLFSKISFHSKNSQTISDTYKKLFDSFKNDYEKKLLKTIDKASLIDEIAKLAHQLINNYKNEISTSLINFFKDIREGHSKLLLEYDKSDFNISKKIIEQNQIALKFMKQINNSSLQKVSYDIKRRDLISEINFFYSYKEKLINENESFISSIVKKIEGEKRILKLKLRNLDDEEKWLEVYKNYLIKNKILKFWKKEKNSILYLKNNKILDVELFVNQEAKIFSENRFYPILKIKKPLKYKIKRIKEVINFEFIITVDIFASESAKIKDQIDKEIKNLLNKKYNIEKLVFTKKDSINEKSNIFNFEQSIKLAEAEVKWSDESQAKLFNLFLNNKELKVSKLERQIKNHKKISENLFHFLDNISKNNVLSPESDNLFREINIFRNMFVFKEWAFNFFTSLAKLTSSKSKVSTKLENEYLAALKFMTIFDQLSINIEKFFIPYKYLETRNKFKLKLIKQFLSGIKVIFIQDDEEFIGHDGKKEIKRILKNVSHIFGSSFVFVSDDFEFLKESYDEIFIFDDFKLLEYGNTKAIIQNPIHPLVKKLVKNNLQIKTNKDLYKKNEYYINNGFIHVDNDDNHYILSSLEEYNRWKPSKDNDATNECDLSQKITQNLTKSRTKNIDLLDMSGYFEENEFFLEDFNKAFPSRNYIKDDLKMEYNEWVRADIPVSQDEESHENIY
ncbi:hypothetical protein AAW50_01260 [Mycoplasmopsis canis]|uniref:MAG1360 family OppF-related protein n=1 Tax=Mycoplasmopsis canis TaxID=29555 RepID=UPI000624D9DB|nr:hypothetical protein [Mycoplasmopsis canis]AKF41065.1 hypothetical protein AAW50_01260 [Mycoplasmopsis canis]